jgi:hypothetical protein
LTLTTNVEPLFATHQIVTWSSSNTAVATVSEYGLVTPVAGAEGPVTITAKIEKGNHSTTCVVEVFTILPPTVADIETYEVLEDINAVEIFINGGSAKYEIGLMSPRLNAWRAAYKAEFPTFDKFVIAIPSTSNTGSFRSIGLQLLFTGTAHYWPFSTRDANITTTLLPIADTIMEQNPTLVWYNANCDARFTELVRYDRTSSTAPTVPHSTTPPGFSGATTAQLNAIHAIYRPLGASTSTVDPDNNFVGFLNSETGFTVIYGGNEFWFRSKKDPTEWFQLIVMP